MPNSFDTLFGSELHGVKYTWYNDPTVTGDRTLLINFDVNMYAAKLTFGLGADQTYNGKTYKKDWQFVSTTADSSWNTDTSTPLGAETITKKVVLSASWKNPFDALYPSMDGFLA